MLLREWFRVNAKVFWYRAKLQVFFRLNVYDSLLQKKFIACKIENFNGEIDTQK